ncbi:MAG: TRAP transporter substrate-binding protein DctP, partial [Candidatus Methylomirabilales bacterium]
MHHNPPGAEHTAFIRRTHGIFRRRRMSSRAGRSFSARRPTTKKISCSTRRSSVDGHRSSGSARRLIAILFALLILTAGQPGEGADSLTIKFATLAPEGSTWMLTLREMDAELQQRSSGRIRFVFYPGGVLGDEIDVIRKIRIGQLHGGAFSGV